MRAVGATRITPQEQWTFAAVASFAIAGAALVQTAGRGELFAAYFGNWNPLALLVAAAAAGLIALRILRPHGLVIAAPGGIRFALAAGTALAAVVIAVDFVADLGARAVPWPWSVPFYLSMAFVVEVVFHLLPLALLLSLAVLFGGRRQDQRLWLGLLAVSLIEPFFQAAIGPPARVWLLAFVWLQVWAVNLAQMIAFRKSGFAAMIALRLTYYAFWHVLWGSLR